MKMMMIMMITLSMIFLMLNHPLSMGLILILQTLMTALIMGYMMESFLFSYIIMMIMLSGALVLFIYMASIASNEKFKFSAKPMVMMPLISISGYMLNSNMYYLYNIKLTESMSLIKIFNTLTAQLTMMMIVYLLLTMVVISNIAKVNEGPLRMKN